MIPELVPEDEPLDQLAARAALIECKGNVTKAAQTMGVEPERLRAYVKAAPALRRTIEEIVEQGVDAAIGILFEGLSDQGSFLTRFYAAKEFLRSEAGRRRGFGPQVNPGAVEIRSSAGPATITLKWIEPPKDG
jgi:hypothetical protein